MRKHTLALGIVVSMCGGTAASGQATLTFIGQGIGVSDLSEDGSVAVGNTIFDGAYETWRWVEGSPAGWQRLGQATVPVIGTGAGSPDVSYDGTRVSATIIGPQPPAGGSPYATQGIWAEGVGWTELLPPLATDGTIQDSYYGSAWGLSGDGTTLSGIYQSNSPFTGSARPCMSTIAGGPVGFPAPAGKNGRMNAVNYDGTIGAGWTEAPSGVWMATVWRDGTYAWIVPDLGLGQNVSALANAINADGSVIVGEWYNAPAARRDAARWDWNGTSYDLTPLGVLPGTPQTFIARVWAGSVSDDGSIIVGTNRFNNNGPFSVQTGFVWTAEGGMRDIEDVLADYGLAFPTGHWATDLTVSPDGSSIGIITLNAETPGLLDYTSYLFRFPPPPPPVCEGDLDNSGTTDVLDFAIFGNLFGTSGHAPFTNGDLDGDGDVDVLDFGIFAADFGCPNEAA